MATTNLIADFLVIGICTMVWLVPAALLTDFDFSLLNQLGVAPSFAFLGAIYVLGICVNRLADDITARQNDRIRDEVFPQSDRALSYHNRLNTIVAQSESAADYLSYRRSIVRITRACAVNFSLGSIAWLLALIAKLCDSSRAPLQVSTVAILICLFVAILLFRAWPVVLRGYFYSIQDMYACLSARRGNTDAS